MIGDSRFFCNYNLEHDDHGHIDSIEFLGSLLPPLAVEPGEDEQVGGGAEPDSTK